MVHSPGKKFLHANFLSLAVLASSSTANSSAFQVFNGPDLGDLQRMTLLYIHQAHGAMQRRTLCPRIESSAHIAELHNPSRHPQD